MLSESKRINAANPQIRTFASDIWLLVSDKFIKMSRIKINRCFSEQGNNGKNVIQINYYELRCEFPTTDNIVMSFKYVFVDDVYVSQSITIFHAGFSNAMLMSMKRNTQNPLENCYETMLLLVSGVRACCPKYFEFLRCYALLWYHFVNVYFCVCTA